MKSSKKILLFLSAICFILLIVFIIDTYAKYKTSATGNANIPIARWNIKVNNQTIKNNSDISSTIAPTFPGNEHIASNIIAPTAEGYFDLNFDFNGADVSFHYEISITPNSNSSVKDLVISGYSIDDGPIIDSSKPIEEDILYTNNITNRNIRVYVLWDDSESASMDNLADTTATTSSNPALLNVNISFTQIAS